MPPPSVEKYFIDLFAGCGGLSLGLMETGWKGLFAIEQSRDAFKTLKHNLIDQNEHNKGQLVFDWPNWLEKTPFEIKVFIRKHQDRLLKLRGKIKLVAGGPPCQGFSYAGQRARCDNRNELFKYHLNVVNLVRPELVLLENVKGIEKVIGISKIKGKKRRGRPRKSYANRIRDMLTKHGYEVQQHILKSADFGVPQFRPRHFTIGVRRDPQRNNKFVDFSELLFEIRKDFLHQKGLPVDRPVTVFEAISDLETSEKQLTECKDEESPPGFKEIVYEEPESNYQKLMHGNLDGRPLNSLRLVNHRLTTIRKFSKILATCRKGVGLSVEDKLRLGINKHTITPLAPDQPSHTLTTLPDDLLHYVEPRVHTVREHARLQSFPDWFEFRGNYTTGGSRRSKECPRYTQVGNAVPPLLAEAVGKALLQIINELPTTK